MRGVSVPGRPAPVCRPLIDADPSGDVEDASGDIFVPVVDDTRGAAGAGAFRLLYRADRRDHPCPGSRGELHRVMAYRPGAAGYQERLALHRSCDEDGAMRGHRRQDSRERTDGSGCHSVVELQDARDNGDGKRNALLKLIAGVLSVD
jgi:hypothetical protein